METLLWEEYSWTFWFIFVHLTLNHFRIRPWSEREREKRWLDDGNDDYNLHNIQIISYLSFVVTKKCIQQEALQISMPIEHDRKHYKEYNNHWFENIWEYFWSSQQHVLKFQLFDWYNHSLGNSKRSLSWSAVQSCVISKFWSKCIHNQSSVVDASNVTDFAEWKLFLMIL